MILDLPHEQYVEGQRKVCAELAETMRTSTPTSPPSIENDSLFFVCFLHKTWTYVKRTFSVGVLILLKDFKSRGFHAEWVKEDQKKPCKICIKI